MIDHVDTETTAQMALLKEELGGKRERDAEGKTSQILSYVRAHAGELITNEQLAAVAGYSSSTSASPAVRKLVESGRLIRKRLKGRGRGHHFTYYVGDLTATPRHHGPAVSNFFEQVEPELEKKKRLEAVDQLEAKAWLFVKTIRKHDTTQVGYVVQALLDYLDFLREDV